jgi:hypothetical protein
MPAIEEILHIIHFSPVWIPSTAPLLSGYKQNPLQSTTCDGNLLLQ